MLPHASKSATARRCTSTQSAWPLNLGFNLDETETSPQATRVAKVRARGRLLVVLLCCGVSPVRPVCHPSYLQPIIAKLPIIAGIDVVHMPDHAHTNSDKHDDNHEGLALAAATYMWCNICFMRRS